MDRKPCVLITLLQVLRKSIGHKLSYDHGIIMVIMHSGW